MVASLFVGRRCIGQGGDLVLIMVVRGVVGGRVDNEQFYYWKEKKCCVPRDDFSGWLQAPQRRRTKKRDAKKLHLV